MVGLALVLIAFGSLPGLCPPCSEAQALVEAGDTSGAIAVLHAATSEDPAPELWGDLAVLLTETASGVEADFTGRAEAEKAIENALRAEPNNPRWLFTHGLLLRKQGVRVDARRMFDRALQAVESGRGSLDSAELARLYAERAEILREHVADFDGFITNDRELSVIKPECAMILCDNFNKPARFHELLLSLPLADDHAREDRERMRALLERGFEIDPSVEEVARGWLGELARQQNWTRFAAAAREHVAAVDGTGWSRIFLGAGLFRLGETAAADLQFSRGLGALAAAERRILENIAEVVSDEVAERHTGGEESQLSASRLHLWTLLDPLHLTDANERFLEHLTRTAIAELWFGAPRLGLRGYETDRGVILIRYGPPQSVRQIERDQERARSAALLQSGKDPMEEFAERPHASITPTEFGGRWILWTYDPEVPSFIFSKQLGSSRVEHAMLSSSKAWAQDLRGQVPSTFDLPGLRTMPHQVARFRGDGAVVEVDVFGALPALGGDSSAAGRAGISFLPRTAGDDVVTLDTEVVLSDSGRTVTFRVPLEAGEYPYSIEAVSENGELSAASRGTVRALPFEDAELSLSDLLLARDIEAPAAPAGEVTGRRDLRIRPAANLTFAVGEPIGVYFEIYGLSASADGDGRPTAGYRVELRITGADEQSLVGDVVAAIGRFFRSEEGTGVIRWEQSAAEAAVAADRIPEWLEVTLPDQEPGSYRLEISVEDANSGEVTTRTRNFSIVDHR